MTGDFRDLVGRQLSTTLADRVYDVAEKLPPTEQFDTLEVLRRNFNRTFSLPFRRETSQQLVTMADHVLLKINTLVRYRNRKAKRPPRPRTGDPLGKL
ncbi:MAG TPA: hypothetical protein VLV78_07855 [Thermoanaerobaculia bacterium]|nr:hypothetical protein [Thermoanaerobaculia bacterium]